MKPFDMSSLLPKKLDLFPIGILAVVKMEERGYLSMKFLLIMIQIRTVLYNTKFELTFILAIVLSACQPSTSSLELPSLFSDNMVLQRNAEVQIWGNSSPQTKIVITLPWGQFDTTS